MENTNKAPVMLISVLATIPSSSQFPCYKSLERTPNGPRFLTKGVPIAMVEPALSKEAPGLLFKLFWVRHWHSQPHFNRGRFGSPSPSSHFSVLHLTRGCCSPHGRHEMLNSCGRGARERARRDGGRRVETTKATKAARRDDGSSGNDLS